MILKELRIIVWLFYATALTVAYAGDEQTLKCVEDNQDIKEYFPDVAYEDLTWDYVTSEEELHKALGSSNHMIVVDIKAKDQTETIISEELTLNKFNSILIEARNTKGIKFNVLDTEAFKSFFTQYPRKSDPILVYPQIFHLNVDNDENSMIDVSAYYNDYRDYYDCYTFSFGWTKSDSIISPDVQKMLKIVENFKMKRKNLIIDLAHTPNTDINKLKEIFTTITFQSDQDDLKSYGMKTLSDIISKCREEYKGKLMLEMPQWLKTHAVLCTRNEKLFKEGEDSVAMTWKSVTKFSDLDETIEEDIIKVDMSGDNPDEMFLGKDFATFINAIAKLKKGLQLNIGNRINKFEKIQHPTLALIPTIPFSVKFTPPEPFSYEDNKWLDAYTLFVSISEGNDPYDSTIIKNLIDTMGDNNDESKYISLDVDRAMLPESEGALEKIKLAKYGLQLVASKVIEAKMLKTFLRKQRDPLFLDWPDFEGHKALFKHTLITELIPELENNLLLLNFSKPVENIQDLEDELKENGKIIQIDAIEGQLELEECLDKLADNNKNGVKIHFSRAAWQLTMEKNYLKYLNFPVWIELDVFGEEKIDLETEEIKYLEKLKHKLVLSFGSENIDAVAMKEKRASLSHIRDITYTIKAGKIADDTEIGEVKELFKGAEETMLVSHSNVITKNFRKNFPKNIKYYLNVPDRLIMEECPKVEEMDEGEIDYSMFTISDYVTDVQQVTKFVDHFDMIRAKIISTKDKLYVDNSKLALEKFFEAFEVASENKTVGIIFTLDKASYVQAMNEPKMKTFNRHIWFDIKVVDGSNIFSDEVVDLKYELYNDRLDCRTLLLGILITGTEDEYSLEDIDQLKETDAGKTRKYAFDLKYAKNSWEMLEEFETNKNMLLQVDESFIKNSAEFREEVRKLEIKNVIIDISGRRKYSTWNCPENRDAINYFDVGADLSKLVLSNFITEVDDIARAIDDKNHMLNVNVKVRKSDNAVIVGDTLTLLQLLETVEKLDVDVGIGIKMTFDSTKYFEAVASDVILVKKIKNLNRPIWINANVIKSGGLENIKLDYNKNDDILDCLTLSLGWLGVTENKYSDENLKAMKNLELGKNDKMYVVDMIHVVKSFNNIQNILLMDDSEDIKRVKPKLENKKVPNGNKVMLYLSDEDMGKLDTDGIQKLLEEHPDLFFYDITFQARKFLFGGSATLSSSLILTFVFVVVSMILG